MRDIFSSAKVRLLGVEIGYEILKTIGFFVAKRVDAAPWECSYLSFASSSCVEPQYNPVRLIKHTLPGRVGYAFNNVSK